MRSDDLLASVFPDQVACGENLTGPIRIPDHPLVNETIDNCLYEAMDLDGLRRVIEGIESGAIRTVAIDTPEPSFLCHEILNANPYAYLDDAPIEERRARAVQLRRTMRSDASDGAGILDPAAIEQVAAESWPEVRDKDELHDALLTLITAPPSPDWQALFDELLQDRRVFVHQRGGKSFWVAAEKSAVTDDPAIVLRGWLESTGPATASALAERPAFTREQIDIALAQLESEGQVMRGHFTRTSPLEEMEWCNRRVLARIHRLTLGRLRREIEPVSAGQFHAFLHRWQYVSAGTQLYGADGLLQIVRQLQGYECPAAAWESNILRERIARYDAEFLDELCLSGEVMWARISPHPGARPTRVAPISLFLREDAPWLLSTAFPSRDGEGAPSEAILTALKQNGASFFADLARATNRPIDELQDALWDLVAAGMITADGFENLRVLIDPKRRNADLQSRRSRSRNAGGRWALLNRAPVAEAATEKWADQLLRRWGVLFRDLLAREPGSPPWRELLPILRRMEARGQIRGGRFVSGFTGEQFARPEALDLLRAIRRAGDVEAPRELSPSDPLNLTGIILPGPRVSPLLLTRAG
jgi:ATP-dependent Lhr-like helicase